jgi:hypothetical protein
MQWHCMNRVHVVFKMIVFHSGWGERWQMGITICQGMYLNILEMQILRDG